MGDLTNTQLLELIDETLAWASDVSEMWTGTLHAELIDQEQAKLINAVEKNDLEYARELVYNLAQTLEHAEKEYER